MRILIVGRYKTAYNDVSPFVREQAEALRLVGNEVECFTIKGKGLKTYFMQRKALLTKIETFHPDIIHAHYGLSGITAVLQHQVPVVTTFHNGETLTFVGNFFSSLFSLRATYVIYVAQHIYDLVFFKRKKHYSILPCGVNIEECTLTEQKQAREELNLSQDKKYILFGGAFNNLRKNYPLLKRAVELLHRTDIQILEMKGLTRKQIVKLMCACDVFALPSKSEGSPQALKEAMACNCPIVATDVADIRHLLGDIEGHYICSFSPEDVADKLRQALCFNARTDGREHIIKQGLDNRQVAERLMNIYRTICEGI